MIYRKFRIAFSKGWTLLLCSFSVAVLALATSCRSKKVTKAAEENPVEDTTSEVVDEPGTTRAGGGELVPTLVLPSDSKAVRDMIEQSNDLKETLSKRMNSVIYGPPEVMQRRAAENAEMRHKIDSLDTEINKARKK